jgi:hypothetical protein
VVIASVVSLLVGIYLGQIGDRILAVQQGRDEIVAYVSTLFMMHPEKQFSKDNFFETLKELSDDPMARIMVKYLLDVAEEKRKGE